MWAAVGLLVIFVGTIVLTAANDAVHPPSHIETVDPAALADSPEYGNPAVAVRPDGSIVVSVVTQMYSFSPDPIVVPANRPVTFKRSGEYIVGCNEYCGILHHNMVGKLIVREESR